MNTIGQSIAAFRKKKGLTQEALAAQIGVSTQSVSKWETGINMPDVMLLPVIADAFGVTIDELYSRGVSQMSCTPDEAFDRGCHAVLEIIGQSIWERGREHFDVKDSFDAYMTDYEQALRRDDRLRTAVLRKHGAVYYREALGGLLLRRPQDGWQTLLEGEDVQEVCRLLGNAELRKVLRFMIQSHMTVFTVPSLCGKCGIADQDGLKALLDSVDWFAVNTVDVGDGEIAVYELKKGSRLFMLLAVAALCKEYATYQDIYYNYNGNESFYME